SSEDAYIMLTSAPPPLVSSHEGKKVLGMSVEGMVLHTLRTLESTSLSGSMSCSEGGHESHECHSGSEPTIETTRAMGIKKGKKMAYNTREEGLLGRRLLSCLMLGLPLVLH
ncbi:unnamed protein product, partial [Meganyctiphanes norvegica]